MKINPLSQLYNDIMKIIDSSIIKYKSLADKYETVESKKQSDAYITACRAEDTFSTYYRYNEEIISEVMTITDPDEISYYQLNRDKIPFKYRDLMLIKQRAYTISHYEEMNNYYRELNGLPNIEDKDFIYVPNEYLSVLGLAYSVPVHTLSNSQISILKSYGFIDLIIEDFPNKTYLKYLGSNKIDIVTSRTSRNFALIRIPYDISESLWNAFSLVYEQCREYFMTCIYITEYRNIIDYYDNFIALCIMIMTIQQVIARTLKSVSERDFFDEYCVRTLFSVYGVPYNENMDSSTRRQIAQSLNVLVQNKGTNKVIYDIASILGYDRLKIFKYYLVKKQLFDDKGFPIQVKGRDGKPSYKSMYDVYFQRVAIDDVDVYRSISDPARKTDYHQIVDTDPYWVEDDTLMEELYKSEYNYVESKYMGVSISYRLTRILFENIYLLRMIFDKKNELPEVTIDIPKISSYATITLFDAVVLLCAITCKQNHLKGEILTKPSQILHVMGFNFERDFDAIKEDIKKNKYLDDSLCDFFEDNTTYTATKLNALYTNFMDLYNVLTEKMSKTDDIKVYQAYKQLYDTIYYSNESQKMFNIGSEAEPKYATTFMEYMRFELPEIYEFINDTPYEQLHVYANHVVSKIMGIIPDLKYLGFYSDASSTMEMMLLELVRFFKSYTTDMIGMNTLLIFDLKPESIIRLIDHIDTLHVNISSEEKTGVSLIDDLHAISIIHSSENINIYDKMKSLSSILYLNDPVKLFDTVKCLNNTVWAKDKNEYVDVLSYIFDNILTEDNMKFYDIIRVIIRTYARSDINFSDVVYKVTSYLLMSHLLLTDDLYSYKAIGCDNDLKLYDSCKITFN